jgi:peptidyl-prolyl cis-trans isomerase SurA
LSEFIFELMRNLKNILAAFSLLFLFVKATNAQPQKVVADKVVAVVGDRIILYSDIRNSILDAQRQGTEVPENAECILLEQALVSKVLMIQAEKDSLPVTDEEVEAELEQRIRYFVGQVGTIEALEEMAGKTVYQIKDDARESVKERKLAEAMQRKIVEKVTITPNEVRAFFEKIPKDSLPYFESELEVGQIISYPKPSRDLEKYIIDEMNNYRRQLLNKTANFDQMAKRFSEDEGTKDRGGLFQMNRNDKGVDPVFLSTAFRLKKDSISFPVKSKYGFHIIQMIERNGDEATVKHILRFVPITDLELGQSRHKLDTVRNKILSGRLDFNEAALKYSDDESVKFASPFFKAQDGSTYVTIDQLDKDVVAQISKMKVGDISAPMNFEDERKKKGVKIIYFKSRTEPHRMNIKDDYSRISQMALEQKKSKVLDKWFKEKLPTNHIEVDEANRSACSNLDRILGKEAKGF